MLFWQILIKYWIGYISGRNDSISRKPETNILIERKTSKLAFNFDLGNDHGSHILFFHISGKFPRMWSKDIDSMLLVSNMATNANRERHFSTSNISCALSREKFQMLRNSKRTYQLHTGSQMWSSLVILTLILTFSRANIEFQEIIVSLPRK